MPHDKIKAAARERMAQTGEPYAAARRAVVTGHQSADDQSSPTDGQSATEGYALRMSDEMHDWLADLRDSDPAVARYVAQAVAALMREGARLGDPLVVSTAGFWPQALIEGQDRSYQEHLERLQALRRTAADADELVKDLTDQLAGLKAGRERLEDLHRQALDASRPEEAAQLAYPLAALQQQMTEVYRMLPDARNTRQRLYERAHRAQVHVDAIRTRKETLKARYTTAETIIRVHEALGDSGLADDEQPLRDSGEVISATRAMIRDLIGQLEREMDQQPWPEGLMELRPGAPDDSESRILFGVEPPGTALLIAALEGSEAVASQRREAVLLSAEMLHRVRAGQAPEASVRGYEDMQSFLDEFYPRDTADSS